MKILVSIGLLHTDIDRSRPPYGLVMKKINRTFDRKVRKWEQLRNVAKCNMMEIGVDKLKVLLGFHFESVMSFTPIGLTKPVVRPTSQVIDLTAEDDDSPPPEHRPTNVFSSRPQFGVPGFPNTHARLPSASPLGQRSGSLINASSGPSKRRDGSEHDGFGQPLKKVAQGDRRPANSFATE